MTGAGVQAQGAEAAVCKKRKTWKELSVLAWPGTLNMLSIIVQGMGLQYISASVSQMISGMLTVFALQICKCPVPLKTSLLNSLRQHTCLVIIQVQAAI